MRPCDLEKAQAARTALQTAGRHVVFVAKFVKIELAFPDPMYEFNTGGSD